MKIAFNVLNSGLGNNGGSRTILLCQKVLEELGHTCDIIGTVDKFTWFDHKKMIRHAPADLDIIIATACTTVSSTTNIKANKKAWYIRAHESWAMPDNRLAKLYNNPNIINIVNSEGLKQKINMYGADGKVVYQGLDIDFWQDRKLRGNDKVRIGCLHTKQARKRWVDFIKLAGILGNDNYEYVGMGSATPPDTSFLTEFIHNANVEQLNNLYSSCHIWFAPTENEGLHNPPMEASLCGCLIVCSDNPMNGMVLDYAFDTTSMIYRFGDIDHAVKLIKKPDWSLIENMQIYIKKNIATREENMSKIIQIIMENK